MAEREDSLRVTLDGNTNQIEQAILQRCENLCYRQRMAFMVQVGCAARTEAKIKDTLSRIAEGSLYKRLLVLKSCHGSKNVEFVKQSMISQSDVLQRSARRLIALLLSDEDIKELLPQLPLKTQIRIVRRLSCKKRFNLVEWFLERVKDAAPEVFRAHLNCASGLFVEKHIAKVAKDMTSALWKQLANRHPQVVLDSIYELGDREHLSTLHEEREWEQIVISIMPQITQVKTKSHTALDLTLLYVRRSSDVDTNVLSALLRRNLHDVVKICLENPKIKPFRFNQHIHRLNHEELVAIAKIASSPYKSSRLPYGYQGLLEKQQFMHLAMHERSIVFETAKQIIPERIMDLSLVKLLPRREQIEVVRQHLETSHSRMPEDIKIKWISMLPWEEAITQIQKYIKSPEAATRSYAVGGLIRLAAIEYSQSLYGNALDLVLSRPRDQDIVRRCMLNELRQLQPTKWEAKHLPRLSKMFRDALNAHDLSGQSIRCLADIAAQIFPYFPNWAWSMIEIVHTERNQRTDSELSHILDQCSIDKKKKAATVASPTLQKWMERKEYSSVVWLLKTYWSPESLEAFPALIDALVGFPDEKLSNIVLESGWKIARYPRIKASIKRIVASSTNRRTADSLLRLLMKESPDLLHTYVPMELKKDASSTLVPLIWTYLCTRRQDLLTPFLAVKYPRGRFDNEKKSHDSMRVRPSDAQYLTEIQQNILADGIVKEIIDEQSMTGVEQNFNLLASLHFVDSERLVRFINDKRQYVRECAIPYLKQLDELKGFKPLLQCLEDDRARVAIYHIEGVLRRVPAQEALARLRKVSLKQITVAKQVVRLAGSLSSDQAYDFLLGIGDNDDIHRDVRSTLITALLRYLDRPDTWRIFEKAALDPKPEIARMVIDVEAEDQPFQQASLRRLILLLLDHPESGIRAQTFRRLKNKRVKDPNFDLLPHVVDYLYSSSGRSVAWNILLISYSSREDLVHSFLIDITDLLLLRTLVQTFVSLARIPLYEHFTIPDAGRLTRCVMKVLAHNRLGLTLYLNVFLNCLPWEEMTEELMKIGPRLHADALVEAKSLVADLHRRRDGDILELEERLRSSKEENLRRLGLSLAVSYDPGDTHREDWILEKRRRLEIYRADLSVLVAEAAAYVTMPQIKDADS